MTNDDVSSPEYFSGTCSFASAEESAAETARDQYCCIGSTFSCSCFFFSFSHRRKPYKQKKKIILLSSKKARTEIGTEVLLRIFFSLSLGDFSVFRASWKQEELSQRFYCLYLRR